MKNLKDPGLDQYPTDRTGRRRRKNLTAKVRCIALCADYRENHQNVLQS